MSVVARTCLFPMARGHLSERAMSHLDHEAIAEAEPQLADRDFADLQIAVELHLGVMTETVPVEAWLTIRKPRPQRSRSIAP